MQNDIYSIDIPVKEIKISKSQVCKDQIVLYGEDNDYPLRFEELIFSSETAKACVDAKANFLATPFANEEMGDVVVGKTNTNKDYTLKKFTKDIATSLATYNGAYIAVQKNLLNQTAEVSVLDFTKVRFSSFDDLGRSNFAYVGDWNKIVVGKKFKGFTKYPLFNSNDEVFKHYAEELGTTTQVYHIFFDDRYVYPCNPFEQCAYDMGTEREIQVNRYEEITQGTPAKLVVRTDFSTDKHEREKQIDAIKQFAGSKGNRVLVIKTQFDDDGNPRTNGYQLDKIEDTRDLSMFSEAELRCANNIRKAINIPAILIDFEQASGITVSGEQMKASVDYFDQICEEEREALSQALDEIFKNTSIAFPANKDFTMTQKTIRYANGNNTDIQ